MVEHFGWKQVNGMIFIIQTWLNMAPCAGLQNLSVKMTAQNTINSQFKFLACSTYILCQAFLTTKYNWQYNSSILVSFSHLHVHLVLMSELSFYVGNLGMRFCRINLKTGSGLFCIKVVMVQINLNVLFKLKVPNSAVTG